MTRYQLVKAEDGITWVSLDPLIQDMYEAMDFLVNINPLELDQDDIKLLDFKIASLKAATEFMSSLLTEQRLRELKEEYRGKLQ